MESEEIEQEIEQEIEKMKDFLFASGFSEPFRKKLLGAATGDMRRLHEAATGDMRSTLFERWLAECKSEWEQIYAQRGDAAGYVGVVRDVYAWAKNAEQFDAKDARDAEGEKYDRRIARLYAGIFQHARGVSLCGDWHKNSTSHYDREEYCEFKRLCGEKQSSDVKDRACAGNPAPWKCAPPMHFEFAAAITIAVVRFVLFACTFSFVGLPSYEARADATSETPESVPVTIVARTVPQRALLDYRVESCKEVLGAQAYRFLVRILRSEYEDKERVFHYITGINTAQVPNTGVCARPDVQLRIEEAAKLVHWCADHTLQRSTTRSDNVRIEVYAGDALLLSAKHGNERIMLARTKYKTNERNEMSVVHVEPETRLAVDSNVRKLVVDALRNGRLGIVCPNCVDRLFPLYYSSHRVVSAEEFVKVALGP
jgi:hypothetical protein